MSRRVKRLSVVVEKRRDEKAACPAVNICRLHVFSGDSHSVPGAGERS
jgi:hypothetical protein